MDTVILEGVEYIKASVAAKRFHYTSDYIGQLCRGKKIDARLVGRTWFVNPESIEEHKQNKHQKQKSLSTKNSVQVTSSETADTPVLASETKSHRLVVEPTLKSKTVKSLGIHDNTGDIDTKHLAVQYEKDDESLVPKITKKTQVYHRLDVNPAEAKQVKVRKRSAQHTSFTAGEIPSFALSGKLKVAALEEPSEPELVEEPDSELGDIPVIKPIKSIAKPKSRQKEQKTQQTSVPKKPVSMQPVVTQEVEMTRNSTKREPVASQKTQAQSFSPKSVQLQPAAPSFFMRFSPAFATAAAIIFIMCIFAASSQIIATDSENTSRVVFQMANLQAVLTH